jgi:hypothetical protein
VGACQRGGAGEQSAEARNPVGMRREAGLPRAVVACGEACKTDEVCNSAGVCKPAASAEVGTVQVGTAVEGRLRLPSLADKGRHWCIYRRGR